MSSLPALVVFLAVAIFGLIIFTARKVDVALPQVKFMEIGGERTHYVDRGGAGLALAMIHDLAGNLMHFTYALVDRFANDLRVIVVDLPAAAIPGAPAGAPADLAAQSGTLAKFAFSRTRSP